jgi:hypothetical protein
MKNVSARRTALALLAFAAGGIGFACAPTALGAIGTTARGCQSQQLHLAGQFLGEADQVFTVTFTFTNASDRACDLTGWPTVGLQTSSGKPVALRTERVIQGLSLSSVRLVALAPGGAASFDIYGADFDTGADKACPTTTSVILVTPPHGRTAFRTLMRVPDCGRFFVAPIIGGRSDRLAWSKIV